MTYTADDYEPGNYYMPCGCWSGQSDHTCGGYRDRCNGCGVPDDCMCHEMCDSPSTGKACSSCIADWRESVEEDHAEALADDAERDRGMRAEATARMLCARSNG